MRVELDPKKNVYLRKENINNTKKNNEKNLPGINPSDSFSFSFLV